MTRPYSRKTVSRVANTGAPNGFTLIELMIVVVIIGILAALAIPRFMTASTRAKQSEAKLILKQIYTEERAYRQLYNRYFIPAGAASAADPMAFMPLKVEMMDASRYSFTITTGDGGMATFTAQATVANPGLDSDVAPDTWEIDQDGNFVAVSDDSVL
jgi:prepilin-type N-terminal cleavage/methylation domain-containing protein